MAKSFGTQLKKLFWPRIALFCAIVLFVTGADAAVYDDFIGPVIDTGKWTVTGTEFSQSTDDGYLHFSATGSPPQIMASTALYASGAFTMPFSNYVCDNTAPGAQGLGSVAALGLGTRSSNNWLRIERGQVRGDPAHGITGGYLEVNWVDPDEAGHPVHVNWIQSEITSGFLQAVYNGTNVTFFYREKAIDPWTQMVMTDQSGHPVLVSGQTQPLVITPGWDTAVPLFIQALTGGDLNKTPPDQFSLSFDVDYVDVSSVPEPTCLFFLAAGLVGLAAAKRRPAEPRS